MQPTNASDFSGSFDALLVRNSEQAWAFGQSGSPDLIIGSVIDPGAMRAHDLDRAVSQTRG